MISVGQSLTSCTSRTRTECQPGLQELGLFPEDHLNSVLCYLYVRTTGHMAEAFVDIGTSLSATPQS